MFKLVRSSDSEVGFSANLDFQTSFSDIVLACRFTGVAVTNLTFADWGTFRYIKRNDTIINSTMSMLWYLADATGGHPRFFSPGAATADGEFFLVIPRGLGDRNVDFVTPEDGARIEIDYGPLFAAGVTAVNMEVKLWQQTGRHLYDLKINRITENLTASQDKTIALNYDNISRVYLSDAQTVPTANMGLNENLTTSATAGLIGNVGATNRGGRVNFTIGDVQATGLIRDFQCWGAFAGNHELNLGTVTAETVETTKLATMAEIYSDARGGFVDSIQDAAQIQVFNSSLGAAVAAVLTVSKRFGKTNPAANELWLSRKLQQISDAKEFNGQTSGLRTLRSEGVIS